MFANLDNATAAIGGNICTELGNIGLEVTCCQKYYVRRTKPLPQSGACHWRTSSYAFSSPPEKSKNKWKSGISLGPL